MLDGVGRALAGQKQLTRRPHDPKSCEISVSVAGTKLGMKDPTWRLLATTSIPSQSIDCKER